MRSKEPFSAAITTLASAQGSVVSRRQLQHLGVAVGPLRRFLAEGRLTPVAWGIYSTLPEAASGLGFVGRCWVGLLIGGSTAVIGGAAALALDGLIEPPDQVDVYVDDGVHRRVRTGYRLRRASRRGRGEPTRALIDDALLDHLGDLSDAAEVVTVVSQLLVKKRTTERRLLAALAQRARQRHRGLLTEVLQGSSVGARSPLELRYARIERAHGLPLSRRQARTAGRHLSDAAYDNYGVLVELDGKLSHAGAKFRDLSIDNANTVLGWSTLRFGHLDLTTNPCGVAGQVGQLLLRRGWPGPDTVSCQRCRA